MMDMFQLFLAFPTMDLLQEQECVLGLTVPVKRHIDMYFVKMGRKCRVVVMSFDPPDRPSPNPTLLLL